MSKRGAVTKNPMIRIFFVILVVVVIATVACFIAMNQMAKPYDSKDKSVVTVTVPSGATTESIGQILVKEKVIESASAFKYYSKFKHYDGKYKAGSYALSPSYSMDKIAKIIESGKTNDITFTIPEGYTEYDIATKLAKLGIVKKSTFIDALESGDFTDSYSFLKDAQSGSHKLEGYLFPSTYSVPADADSNYIINAMLKKYDSVFTDKYKARAKKLGYSENEIIIVASIIEKESGVDKDRSKIASVIYNRLKISMPLQMDSTVQYVLGLDNNRKKDLSNDDTQVDSPYNTYTNAGLPPGPICCPGEASIKAALYPDTTKYIYFILSDKLDDSMTFSTNYKQFLKDKEAYYDARDAQEKDNN